MFELAKKILRLERLAVFGFLLLLFFHLFSVGLLPIVLARHGADEINLEERLQAPGERHFLGTDELGRDVLSRIAAGVKISLAIGCVSIAISMFIGMFIGCVSGYYGAAIDYVIMRFIEVCLAFPNFFLVMVITSLTSASTTVLTIVIGLTSWFKVAMLTRNKFRSIKEKDFIIAAKALGVSDIKIILKYLIPNIFPHVMVAATYGVGNAILVECSLSYIGVGIQEPVPSLGNMLYHGKKFILRGKAFWLSLYPGLAILCILLGYHFLGDGLARVLTPFDKEKFEKNSL